MRSYWFMLISSLILGASLASCTAAGSPTSTEDSAFGSSSGLLEIRLDLDKNSYLSGEPITAALTLINLGERDIVVNGRMIPNEPTAPERLRDIVFSIRGPAGKLLIPKVLINVRAPGDSDFVTLSPGEPVEKEVVLDEIYALAQPGTYSIQAIYLNISDPSYSAAWKGQVSSDLVMFTLED